MATGRGGFLCHRVLKGHLHSLWPPPSSFWKNTQNHTPCALFSQITTRLCILFPFRDIFGWILTPSLPVWSCLLESLTSEWWGHISHVPTGQQEMQLSRPPLLGFASVLLSAGPLQWSMENSLKKSENIRERGGKTVSSYYMTETPPHACFKR